MIYRVSVYGIAYNDGHAGYFYCGSLREAKARRAYYRRFHRENGGGPGDLTIEIESASTPATKAEMIELLNRWGDHPDNG